MTWRGLSNDKEQCEKKLYACFIFLFSELSVAFCLDIMLKRMNVNLKC
jgi:hypothetical protein